MGFMRRTGVFIYNMVHFILPKSKVFATAYYIYFL